MGKTGEKIKRSFQYALLAVATRGTGRDSGYDIWQGASYYF